jgi:hypothetical protein
MVRPSRTGLWLLLAGIGQTLAILLLPECPACLTVDLGVIGALFVPAASWRALFWTSLVLAAICISATVSKIRSGTLDGPCASAERLPDCCFPMKAATG